MLEEADRDGDGMINPDEFYRLNKFQLFLKVLNYIGS